MNTTPSGMTSSWRANSSIAPRAAKGDAMAIPNALFEHRGVLYTDGRPFSNVRLTSGLIDLFLSSGWQSHLAAIAFTTYCCVRTDGNPVWGRVMQPTRQTVHQVFDISRRLVVPLYQRA